MSDIEVAPVPLDDPWMRDSGPTLVRRGDGALAALPGGLVDRRPRRDHASTDFLNVSGRKKMPRTKVAPATTIGYQSP